jgi:hypothetical protein
MVKILATLTAEEYKRLCTFDYCDLYSIHKGMRTTFISDSLDIFVGTNRHGRLYINVNFYPEGHNAFDFDKLDKAITWAKNRVKVDELPKEESV